jgi:hypothetical protein
MNIMSVIDLSEVPLQYSGTRPIVAICSEFAAFQRDL